VCVCGHLRGVHSNIIGVACYECECQTIYQSAYFGWEIEEIRNVFHHIPSERRIRT